jgi:predicted PurR-regulated permease PerM
MEQPNRSANALVPMLRYLQIITLVILLMYFGKGLFIPMFYGLLIAMVMYPVCKWLETRQISRSIAIAVSLSIVTILFVILLALLAWQLSLFQKDLPGLTQRMQPLVPRVQAWLGEHFISRDMQQEWLNNTAKNISGNAGTWLRSVFNATATTLFLLFLVPIHAALFLYHRGTFVRFLYKLFGDKYRAKTDIILKETIHTYFNYIKGMIIVYIIVGVLNSIGLMVLGIRHAILFGMMTAIMTIIPYVGIIISALLPISVAFIATGSIWYPIGVVAVFSFVQYLEANIIFPKVVGTQLNVSTWATLVAIMVGGIIWGVSGMILFIPFVAILKIITDNLEEFEALNILLSRDKHPLNK